MFETDFQNIFSKILKVSFNFNFRFNNRFLKQVDGCTIGGPLSVTFSDIYRNLFKQMAKFFKNIFQRNQCGFRKGYNTQQCF